jgi:cytoskeleton protein RodZ
MQAIGERLREARMRQKIDIAEVETATKIRAKYLRALENDEFGLLPGSTFVKTFLRTYAEYLGLDATLLVEEYRVHYEPRGESEPMQHFAPPRRRVPRRSRYATGPPGPGTAVVVLVLTVLVIFAVLGLTSGGNKSNTTSQSANQTKAKKKAPKKKAKPAPPPKPKRVTVRVVPLAGGTYVCLDRGPGTKKVFEGILPPNAGRKWRGSRVRIIIGHTPIKLTANGKLVNVPSSAAAVSYDITPRRTKPIPPGPKRPCQ